MSNVSSAFVRDVLDGNAAPVVVASDSDNPHRVMQHLSRPPKSLGFVGMSRQQLIYLPSYTRNHPEMYSYVVGVTICGRVFYKVGVTQAVHKRVNAILSGLPPAFTELQSVSVGLHNVATAPNVEQEVLAAFSERWAGGEWIVEKIDSINRKDDTDGR